MKRNSRQFGALLTAGLLAGLLPAPALAAEDTAIFAGGCFWCIEKDFEHVKGVTDVISGYTGGTTENPTYKNHTAAGHREAVKITFDPDAVTYEQLLNVFWHSVDPTDGGGQFCDRGHSYTTAIYAVDDAQKTAAETSKVEIEKSGVLKASVVTPVEDAATFYPAEDYHQDYSKKSTVRYKYYRFACGRDKRVEQLWGADAHTGIDYGS